MPRRRLDAETRWRIMQHEAYRTIGRRHPWTIILGPALNRLGVLVVAVAGLMALWLHVDHVKLGVGALLLALVIGVGWLAVSSSRSDLQSRMVARARGTSTRPGFGMGWAVAGAVVLLSATGWLSLWSPWA